MKKALLLALVLALTACESSVTAPAAAPLAPRLGGMTMGGGSVAPTGEGETSGDGITCEDETRLGGMTMGGGSATGPAPCPQPQP